VRALAVFGQHDLGQRAPFPRIDLALCRNVLIYFTPELQKRALQLFAFSLRDGGYLVLGKAESTSPLPQHFVLREPRLKIYRREGERVLIPPVRLRDSTPPVTVRAAPERSTPGTELSLWRPWAIPVRGRAAGDKAQQVLRQLPQGVVVVDRRYDIQSINSAARRLLAIHSSAIGEDFVHLAQSVPSTPLPRRWTRPSAARRRSPSSRSPQPTPAWWKRVTSRSPARPKSSTPTPAQWRPSSRW